MSMALLQRGLSLRKSKTHPSSCDVPRKLRPEVRGNAGVCESQVAQRLFVIMTGILGVSGRCCERGDETEAPKKLRRRSVNLEKMAVTR